jgi:Glycosyltransferases, probably involved in cell wall biogenesis
MIKKWIILIVIITQSYRDSIATHKPITPLTTSVIIPCHYKHTSYLFELLGHLQSQTIMPHEVVISISEVDKADPIIIEKLHHTKWAFTCKIITSTNVQYAGENRNIGCRNATGDIFILQDADDIPHPQRIEVITYFFEHYPIDHLIHYCNMILHRQKPDPFTPITNIKSIRLEWQTNFKRIGDQMKFTNGNIAISRKVFDQVQWPTQQTRTEDYDFNNNVYKLYKKRTVAIHVSLLHDRMLLSTARNS